jgi:hypothetical protein
MNIFVLDKDPVLAAQQQCDKHIVKMITESAQMLSTAQRILDGKVVMQPSKSGKRIVKHWDLFLGSDDLEAELMYFKAVHVNHPCTLWTMESSENYKWHWEHYRALCEEYEYRYGGNGKTHGSARLLYPLRALPRNIPIGPMTPFKLAMGSNPECVVEGNPVESYRRFYITKQDRFSMKWTNREVPEWFEYRSQAA